MASEEKKLIYRLEAENEKYLKKLSQSEAKLRRFASQTKRQNTEMRQSFSYLEKRLVAFASAFSFAKLIGGIVKTSKSFETLNAQLKTIEGSQRAADLVFKRIQDFATKTPFQLEEIVDAFVRLKNRGIEPTEEVLTGFGNISASMGKSLEQISEAVADAITGEFERLKEFGIKASKQGDIVKFTFRGVTTEIRNSADDISQYLRDIGNIQFAGAMTEQMDTLAGVTSNLEDAFSKLSLKIDSETGFTDALKNAGKAITEFVNDLAGVPRPVADIQAEIDKVTAALAKLDEAEEKGNTVRSRQRGRNVAQKSMLSDRLQELKDELLETQLTSTTITDVEAGIQQLTNSIQDIETKIQQQIDHGLKPTAGSGRSKRLTQLGKNIEQLETLKDELTSAQALLQDLNDTAINKPEPIDVEGAKEMDKALKELKKTLEGIRTPGEVFNDQIRTLDKLFNAGKATYAEYQDAVKAYRQEMQDAIESTEAFKETQKAIAEVIDLTKSPLVSLLEELEKYNKLLISGDISVQQWEMVNKAIQADIEKLDEMDDKVSEFSKEAERNLQNGLVDVLVDGFDNGLSSMLDSFADFLKQAAAELLASQLLELMKELFGTGDDGTLKFFDSIGSAFAGAFADGGQIGAGQFGLVGDEGPELISGPANVIPFKKLGGDNVTINIDARNADPLAAEQFVAMGNALEQKILNTVSDRRARGRL